VPFLSRKRVDSLGMVHQRGDSFDDGSAEDPFEETGADDDTTRTKHKKVAALKKQVDLLELELQEKSMELKLAAEIGQMLLEKEQSLSERCKRHDTDEMRMKTELQE